MKIFTAPHAQLMLTILNAISVVDLAYHPTLALPKTRHGQTVLKSTKDKLSHRFQTLLTSKCAKVNAAMLRTKRNQSALKPSRPEDLTSMVHSQLKKKLSITTSKTQLRKLLVHLPSKRPAKRLTKTVALDLLQEVAVSLSVSTTITPLAQATQLVTFVE